MSFRILPGDILRRLQGIAAGEGPSEPEAMSLPAQNLGTRARGDNYHDPSPIDIVVVRTMLAKGLKLPVDLVDGILEHAEYWVRTTTAVNYPQLLRAGKGHGEDKFLLRTLPVGFINEHGGKLDLTGQPAIEKRLKTQISAATLARMANYPLPKLHSPVRKIVFTITGRDQGTSIRQPAAVEAQKASWTWFEVGLERLEGDAVGQVQGTPPTPLQYEALRPVWPTLRKRADGDDESVPHLQHEEDEHGGDGGSSSPDDEDENTALRYNFILLPSPTRTVCRNKAESEDWQMHKITWSCDDDVKPDSDRGKVLETVGRGRGTGNGAFVRSLEVGDVVTLWAKGRFINWTNRVKDARIDVYWSAT